MTHEFALHYNIHNVVMRYQNTKETRRSRPMRSSTAQKLARLRAKTFFIRIDEIDVMFALDQLAKNHEGVSVLMEIGVSSVNPGNLPKYHMIKQDIKKMKDSLREIKSETLSKMTEESIKRAEEAAAKVKPDNYSRKLGRERAKEAAKNAVLKLTSASVQDGRAVLRLVSDEIAFDYVKNFKTGSVRLHLVEVDGIEVAAMLPYN